MNTFNRVVIVVLLLVLLPLVSVLFVIPHVILPDMGLWVTNLGYQLWAMEPWQRLGGGILLALIFDALAVSLIVMELRRPRRKFIRVQELSGGTATLSVESVVEQLQYRLDPLPNVIEVKPAVRAKGNKVAALVDVTVAPGVNVPAMASRLVEAVREVLMEDLGLQVAGAPQVRLKVAPPPKGKPSRSQPPVPPARSLPTVPPARSLPPAPAPSYPEKPLEWAGLAEPEHEEPFA